MMSPYLEGKEKVKRVSIIRGCLVMWMKGLCGDLSMWEEEDEGRGPDPMNGGLHA